jgi:hypothetical protein
MRQHCELRLPARLVGAASVDEYRAPREHAGKRKILHKADAVALLGDCPDACAHDRLAYTALLFPLPRKVNTHDANHGAEARTCGMRRGVANTPSKLVSMMARRPAA